MIRLETEAGPDATAKWMRWNMKRPVCGASTLSTSGANAHVSRECRDFTAATFTILTLTSYWTAVLAPAWQR